MLSEFAPAIASSLDVLQNTLDSHDRRQALIVERLGGLEAAIQASVDNNNECFQELQSQQQEFRELILNQGSRQVSATAAFMSRVLSATLKRSRIGMSLQSTSQNIVTRINVNESTGTFDRTVQREEILGIEEGMNVERVDNIVPTYKMCGAITTVPFCWQEYKLGWNGGPALAELEDKYGAKWRRSGSSKEGFQQAREDLHAHKRWRWKSFFDEKCGGSKARESSSRKRNDSHQVK
ncbi:hypothetical protein BC829DRAFT_479126 [Chytridium lagenaria]|nr:hypothetical protein BC829DRAFT_479126 [Chytridium lagenaria]